MITFKKKRGIAVIVSAVVAVVMCVIGIVAATANVLVASGEVFDYSKSEKVVRYKDYQSDPADAAARKGLLLYAYDNGASVPFKTSFTGDFSAELTAAANEEGSVELKQYSLLFHDVETGAEFSVVIKNKPAQKDASVSYKGERAGIHYHEPSSFSMYGLTGEYNAADEYTFFSSQSAYISFNPDLMEIKLRLDDGVDRTVWNFSSLYNDGKKLEHDLPTFGEYTVSVVFDEITSNSRGDILIYSFGNCNFNTTKADFAPTLFAKLDSKAVLNNEYVLPMASIVDVIEGALDATAVTVDVYDAKGVKVNDGYSFTPTQAGTYYVYYSYDKDGKSATAYYAIDTISENEVVSEYYLDGTIAKTATVGVNTQMYIPRAAVESTLLLSTATMYARVSIYKDGTVVTGYDNVPAGFTYSFAEEGEYQIVYSTPMLTGKWEKTESFAVTVSASTLGVVLSESIEQTMAVNTQLTLPTAKMYLNGEEMNPVATLVYPSGVEKEEATVVLDETGAYALIYRAGDNEYTVNFYVKETYAGLFVDVDGNVGTYEEVLANNETTGVKLALRENVKFQYEKIIDLSDNTFDNTLEDRSENSKLIEMYAQPHKVDSPDVDALFIVLTDVYNPDNYVEIRMKYISYSPQGVYIRTRAAGQANWVGYNYNFYTTALAVHDAQVHEEGGFFSYLSMTHNFHAAFKNFALKLYYDNETKCLYGDPAWKYGHTNSGEDKSIVTPWLIRDFKTTDTELSAGNKPWGGFTTGEVYLTVYAKGVTDTADFYITELDGESLGKEFIEPAAPTLTINMQDNATAAYAQVGKPYKIIDYTATNGSIAIVEEEVSVRRVENGVLTSSIRVKDGAFTPVAAVTYAIIYKVTNAYGLTTEKQVIVEAKNTLDMPTLQVDLSTLPTTAFYGEEITLPEAFGYGGAGWAMVSYEVEHNGKLLEIDRDRFTCSGTGKFTIKIKVTDYVGQTTEVTHIMDNVTVSSQAILDESTLLLPPAFIEGDTFTFTKYTATVYDDNLSMKTLEAKITVKDGASTTVIGADGKYTPAVGSAIDSATVTYTFGEGSNALAVTRTLPVLRIKNASKFLTNYFVAENATKDADAHNVYFTAVNTEEDMSFSFIRPIDSNVFSLKLNFHQESNQYQSVTVTMQDIYDRDCTAEILLEKEGAKLYASVNGGKRKDVYVDNNILQIRYSSATKEFTNSLGVLFGKLEGGFTNNSIYLTVTANGVYGESKIGVQNINGQTINLINRDLQKPVISLCEEFEGLYAIGHAIQIPAAGARDVLNGVGDVRVTIQKEGGTVFVDGVSAAEEQAFIPEELGYYAVTYTVRDNAGNQQTVKKTFSVYDSVKPSITFKTEVPKTVAVGTTLQLPSYTLEDNYSLNDLVVRIYFATPDGLMQRVTGSSVKFEVKGYYTIHYLVMDKNNNIATYVFSVKAE